MLVQVSSSYRPLSRKRKPLPKVRRTPKAAFQEYVPESKPYRRPTKSYPSVVSAGAIRGKESDDYKKEVSSKYTIAPAYNKGAYQLIAQDNVKDIGR